MKIKEKINLDYNGLIEHGPINIALTYQLLKLVCKRGFLVPNICRAE